MARLGVERLLVRAAAARTKAGTPWFRLRGVAVEERTHAPVLLSTRCVELQLPAEWGHIELFPSLERESRPSGEVAQCRGHPHLARRSAIGDGLCDRHAIAG